MPEGTKDAVLLIATSWQALNRAIRGEKETQICDCMVAMLFAGIFIEANLNYIIKEIGMEKEMGTFLNNKKHPGLEDKLSWFYNIFIADSKVETFTQLKYNGIRLVLRNHFNGYDDLVSFRNDISHGFLNRVFSSEETAIYRQQAKEIVNELFIVISNAGYKIERTMDFNQVIYQ